ncbi:FHA domain-containing protein [Aliikangiella sp. IMCC44359]|uniref:FHA domain-containing protein n=1 Tax=Aliikangiella sp. IMCC44359 TaxID=3459125 RepID=UPI00403ADB0E
MTNKEKQKNSTGPQGTQVFDLSDVNKMIAKEITESQPDGANVPALVGVSENVSGQRFILNQDKLEVGRRPNSDIKLSDASVSSMHAQIIREDNDWKVLNLLSSNGTFVNGEKVAEKFIYPGDRIAFAGAEFVYTLVEKTHLKRSTSKKHTITLTALMLVLAFASLLYFIL